MKYFMEELDEYTWPLQHFIDEDEDNIILFEMKRDIGGEMWCDIDQLFVDDYCGNTCNDYNPCNGKNGRCRNLKNGFVETGKKYKLNDGKIILLEK